MFLQKYTSFNNTKKIILFLFALLTKINLNSYPISMHVGENFCLIGDQHSDNILKEHEANAYINAFKNFFNKYQLDKPLTILIEAPDFQFADIFLNSINNSFMFKTAQHGNNLSKIKNNIIFKQVDIRENRETAITKLLNKLKKDIDKTDYSLLELEIINNLFKKISHTISKLQKILDYFLESYSNFSDFVTPKILNMPIEELELFVDMLKTDCQLNNKEKKLLTKFKNLIFDLIDQYLADLSFLVEFLKSFKNEGYTTLITGAAHTDSLTKYLSPILFKKNKVFTFETATFASSHPPIPLTIFKDMLRLQLKRFKVNN